jgi:hypothetical protein
MKLEYDYLDYLYKEVGMKKKDAEYIAQQGDDEDRAREIANESYFFKQFKNDSDEKLIDAVQKITGEVSDCETREDALMYLAWMVAWDIVDNC